MSVAPGATRASTHKGQLSKHVRNAPSPPNSLPAHQALKHFLVTQSQHLESFNLPPAQLLQLLTSRSNQMTSLLPHAATAVTGTLLGFERPGQIVPGQMAHQVQPFSCCKPDRSSKPVQAPLYHHGHTQKDEANLGGSSALKPGGKPSTAPDPGTELDALIQLLTIPRDSSRLQNSYAD